MLEDGTPRGRNREEDPDVESFMYTSLIGVFGAKLQIFLDNGIVLNDGTLVL